MENGSDTTADPVTDTEIKGLWRRAYLKAPAKFPDFEDHDTQVYWFQAEGLYADVRIPARFSEGVPAASLAEFSDEELRALAEAEGFAGWAAVVDGVCTWQRAINLQGPETGRDIGRLERAPRGLFEYGVDADFVELWLDRQMDETAPQGRVFTCDGGFWGFLITSRTRFLFACDRPSRKNLARPWRSALAQALATGDREELTDLFQAEYSFGRIVDGAAVIDLSSHPNRVGALLCDDLHATHKTLATLHSRFDGKARKRHWTVAELNVFS